MSEHARFRLDPALNNPIKLSIVAAVAETDEVEFGVVKDSLGLTAPTLSKMNGQLEELGYLKVRKGYIGKRPRTWLGLTRAGRSAYEGHIAALREIAGI